MVEKYCAQKRLSYHGRVHSIEGNWFWISDAPAGRVIGNKRKPPGRGLLPPPSLPKTLPRRWTADGFHFSRARPDQTTFIFKRCHGRKYAFVLPEPNCVVTEMASASLRRAFGRRARTPGRPDTRTLDVFDLNTSGLLNRRPRCGVTAKVLWYPVPLTETRFASCLLHNQVATYFDTAFFPLLLDNPTDILP